jgi:S-DNA-T family DNA segregation ATPase FtsK/SpoIIIE
MFFPRPESKFRAAAVLGALVLGFASILLGFSIASALFDLPLFAFGPGDFFVRSYGFLAFMIPAYLFGAAIILADPVYRPSRIFVLSCTILPFLTLAIGFAFFRDFDARAEQFAFLAAAGRVGFSFIVIFLTVFESLLIIALDALLFPQEARRNDRTGTPGKGGNTQKKTAPQPAPLLLPDGVARPLPELKPLASAKAFQDFEFPPLRDAEVLDEEVPVLDEEVPMEIPGEEGDVYDEPAIPDEEPPLELDEIDDDIDDELEELDPDNDEPRLDADVEKALAAAEQDSARHTALEKARHSAPRSPAVPAFDTGHRFPPDPETGAEPAAQAEDEPVPAAVSELEAAPGLEAVTKLEAVLEPEAVPEPEAAPGPEPVLKPEAAPKTGAGAEAVPVRSGNAPKPKAPLWVRIAYKLPVEGLLNQYPDGQYWIIDQATRDAAITLKETLKEFNIQAEVTGIRKGPVITMFEILPAPGVKLSKIVNLQDNIALRLAASSVRIVAPIPGKHAVGIEVPNMKRNIVSFREIIEGELHREGKKLEIPVVLGKDITGEAQTVDLVQMPHLLIAGATGSGKSVCVNSMILSILYQKHPAECRLILIDPKIVELKLYNDIPHLLTPVITEPKRAFQALQYCIYEMERRYACLDSMGVRDVRSYNRRIRERNMASEHLPYLVVVIDEFADLMATTGKELESTVARLAAMSRAVGIHLVLATQRPSIDVITGLIKANIPSRIAFMVASKMDSRIIIDMVGAEKLLGKGDMLYAGVVDPFPIRIQGAFISEEEVERVVEYVKTLGNPDYIDDEIFYDEEDDEFTPSLFAAGEDPLYEKALEIVMQQGKASASYIQRRLKIGYNRAARLVEEMEHQGVVGPAQGSRPRELLRSPAAFS